MKQPSPTWESFTRRFHLRTKTDACGESIAPGTLGHAFWYGDSFDGGGPKVGFMFMPARVSKGWKHRREALVAAGARVAQNGDTEGTVVIPLNGHDKTIRLACKLMGIKRRTA